MAKRHLDPKIKAIWMLPSVFYSVILWLLLVFSVFYMSSQQMLFGLGMAPFSAFLLAAIMVFVLLPIYAYHELYYESFLYELAEHDVSITHGILTKHTTTIPYVRITDVHIHKSILFRIFGLVSIYIKTPSPMGMEEGEIPGVSESEHLARQIADRVSFVKEPEKHAHGGASSLPPEGESLPPLAKPSARAYSALPVISLMSDDLSKFGAALADKSPLSESLDR